MSDLARKQEMQQILNEVGVDDPEYVDRLYDAARRVLEGEQVQWCETHWSILRHEGMCAEYELSPKGNCSIVPKLLVDGE